MEKEIVKLTKDVEFVKGATAEIKDGVASLIARAEENHVDIVDLRGRVRELEHDSIESKAQFKELKSLIWKIASALGIGGGSAVTILEIFGK